MAWCSTGTDEAGAGDPAGVVWLRSTGAVVVLAPLALARGALRGLARRWPALLALLALSAVQVTAPFLLITIGEQSVTSSLAGLLVAAEPLLVVVLLALGSRLGAGRAVAGERVTALRVVGLVVGFTGVGALLGVDVGGAQRLGAGLVLAAALLYAVGALLIRSVTSGRGGADPVGVITAILTVNTVVLAPFALPALPQQVPPPTATASLAALALLCTAVAFVAYFALIGEVGPARGTVVFFVTPVVTVAAGAAILGEPLTSTTLLGLALIVAGSWLATSGGKPPPRQAGGDQAAAPAHDDPHETCPHP